MLFRHFRGWTWSERSRDTSSWLWDFGYDIQRHGLRKWACKDCILVNRPTIASFTSSGLQNAANHLWREHKTPAPEGEKKSTAQLKSEGALKSNQPTIASVLKLDVNKPTEQNTIHNPSFATTPLSPGKIKKAPPKLTNFTYMKVSLNG
jgi:hypothetical protein